MPLPRLVRRPQRARLRVPFAGPCSSRGDRCKGLGRGVVGSPFVYRDRGLTTRAAGPVSVQLRALLSALPKPNGLKDPIWGLTRSGLDNATWGKTRDEQECVDAASLPVVLAENQNGVACLHFTDGRGIQLAISAAGRGSLSDDVNRYKVKMDGPAAPGLKIAKDKLPRESVHGFDGPGKAAETARDNHPGPHALGSGNPFRANVYRVSGHKCVPTAADSVARIVRAGRQNPERHRSRGVDRDV